MAPAGVCVIKGKVAQAWNLCQLPAEWQKKLEAARVRENHRCVESYLNDSSERWPPPLPLDEIHDADLQEAVKNREIFRPFLQRQHSGNQSAAETEAAVLREYKRVKGTKISPAYFRKLFKRFGERAGNSPDFDELAIYLPARPRPKEILPDPIAPALAAEFERVDYFIRKHVKNTVSPSRDACAALWGLCVACYRDRVAKGEAGEEVTSRLVEFLAARAKFLAPTAAALRKTLLRRLANGMEDGRKKNGNRPKYPEDDLKRIRASAVTKGGRIDAAWRAVYKSLSDYTRERHVFKWQCPRSLKKAVNKDKVNVLCAADKGDRALKNACGYLTLDYSGLHSMDHWVMDDLTSDIQVVLYKRAGEFELIRPQIVATLDNVSRKIVGWAMSNDKGPTSRLVCVSVKMAMKAFGVPRKLGLENGWVFGKANNVNGKEDEASEKIVFGLAKYGCEIYHFERANPTGKANLENVFKQINRLMQEHPGYGGSIQMLHARDEYKREESLIKDGAEPCEYRYTFDEFKMVFKQIVDDYNAMPQPYGRLAGMSPDEAFEKLRGPVKETPFNNELAWLLDEQYTVKVKSSGVEFTHYGKPIQVKGGELPRHVGEKWFALVDRTDASMVTFMSLDYSQTFTVEAMPQPSANESIVTADSGLVAEANRRKKEHNQAFKEQLRDLRQQFGDSRHDCLAKIRGQPLDIARDQEERRVLIDPQMAEAGEAARLQREDVLNQRRQRERQERQVEAVAEETGLNFPADGLADLTPEQIRKMRQRYSAHKNP